MVTVERPRGVHLSGISFAYPHQETRTLNRVSWQIERGDFFLVTGPSGGGKSTLLRCLNGLVPHFSGGRFGGEAAVFGIDTRLHGPRELSKHVGFVFQDPESQAVARIVEDDIAFGMEQAGITPGEMRKRVEEVLDLLSIAALRSRDIATLSGGERQRVAIAGAMARRPELLVLDEPTSQLDPWGADEVLTALHRLNDDLGLAVVVAEHRLDRVIQYADRVRILSGDGSVLDLPPAEALDALPEPDLPPLARFSRHAGLTPIPMTVKDARRRIARDVTGWEPTAEIMTSGDVMIRAAGVSVSRGYTSVLRDVNLNVHQGELVAVMGRNGSGKTTLIRSLLGMQALSNGIVELAGIRVQAGKPEALAGTAAYLPQDPAKLLFAETVRQEIDASLAHLPPPHLRRDPEALLDAFDLSHRADHHPRDLSTGERERAALAAVLVGAPKVLMLDEPTRGMDGTRKRSMMQMLAAERERGAAIVMATHDVELVAQWADRVVLLGDGEIIADGSPRDVLAGSITFSPIMNRLFGGSILTVDDALQAIEHSSNIP